MFSRLLQKLQSYSARFILEQLEERIVLDAAAAPTADQSVDDNEQITEHTDSEATDTTVSADSQPEGNGDGGEGDPLNEIYGQDLSVVLISNALDEVEALSDAAVEDAVVVVYDAEQDTLSTIVNALSDLVDSTGQEIGRLAILSHGKSGGALSRPRRDLEGGNAAGRVLGMDRAR